MSKEAMKLVPVEPTEEMLKAMDECSTEGYDERLYAGHAASVYMAALDAAPISPAEQNHTGCACQWNEEGDRVITCARHEGWLEVIAEWADRAREAEKKLKALNPCPTCEALARTVMLDQTSHDAQCKPTDEMVVAAARVLSERHAAACSIDWGDLWKLYGNDFIDDARAAFEAAYGIKE